MHLWKIGRNRTIDFYFRQYWHSKRGVKNETYLQMMLESGAEYDHNPPTLTFFDLFKLLREETILGVEIGLAAATIFHLYF
tara:strand:- start:2555 stop:2797 length:243 start_codon:yes stop_codon:yes gene_type:complete